jgi:hypothetical protein
MNVSARAARQRTILARWFAGDRLHFGDLFRGENDAVDPTALDLTNPQDDAHGNVFATA